MSFIENLEIADTFKMPNRNRSDRPLQGNVFRPSKPRVVCIDSVSEPANFLYFGIVLGQCVLRAPGEAVGAHVKTWEDELRGTEKIGNYVDTSGVDLTRTSRLFAQTEA